VPAGQTDPVTGREANLVELETPICWRLRPDGSPRDVGGGDGDGDGRDHEVAGREDADDHERLPPAGHGSDQHASTCDGGEEARDQAGTSDERARNETSLRRVRYRDADADGSAQEPDATGRRSCRPGPAALRHEHEKRDAHGDRDTYEAPTELTARRDQEGCGHAERDGRALTGRRPMRWLPGRQARAVFLTGFLTSHDDPPLDVLLRSVRARSWASAGDNVPCWAFAITAGLRSLAGHAPRCDHGDVTTRGVAMSREALKGFEVLLASECISLVQQGCIGRVGFVSPLAATAAELGWIAGVVP
jgi:hypothetical protein